MRTGRSETFSTANQHLFDMHDLRIQPNPYAEPLPMPRSLPAVLRPIMHFLLAGLLVLGLSRLGLSLWKANDVSQVTGWSQVFLQGIRVDIATLALLLTFPAMALVLLPTRRWLGVIISLWLAGSLTVIIQLELATPGFMGEYGLRPNRLFLEYLIYPREVFSTLWHGRPFQLLLIPAVAVLVFWIAWRATRPLRGQVTNTLPLWLRPLLALAILILGVLGVRSTLGHRPLNPAMVAFSSNPLVNQLPLNSFYALSHATRQWIQQEDSAMDLYGPLPEQEVVAAVRASTGLPPAAFPDDTQPGLARRQASFNGRPRNLVIILEESLGAQFIGHLGGLPLSPNLDRLSQDAWTFQRMYATGTRSVRGIEAVVAGFPPTPAQAVVKQPGAQQDFYTLAQTLRERGYDTTFYYGGESHFDNMRSFFFGNGFERIIEQKDYLNPSFTGSWGASDEDVLLHAEQEFSRLHAAGKPFFGFVFTSSNHDPFEFPDGRIDLYEQPKNTRNNAARYADYAVGRFFDKARSSAYWQDTVFLIVADHDSRVFGQDLVPIDNFHIPAMILGAGISPRQDQRIASQIDLGPTLLSLIGISAATPMPGRDLADAELTLPGRAMMQYENNFAWLQNDEVVILQPNSPARQYHYRPGNNRLLPVALDTALSTQAHAQALWGSLAYQRQWYKNPPTGD